ncbi:hypothetical protein ASG07_15785 [Sphingomonas sp. Leaf343]|nr:hypothetical protein ASG07_15785 [Sphingomonas sp. Leaf343]
MVSIATGSALVDTAEALVLIFSALGLRTSLFDLRWLFAMLDVLTGDTPMCRVRYLARTDV